MNTPLLLRIAMLLLAVAACVRAQEPVPAISISELRALSAQEAAGGRAVRTSGIVTHISPSGSLLFIQDDGGGIAVAGTREKKGEIKLGTLVEVEGVTASGRLLPYITAARRGVVRVTAVAEEAVPEPREATIAQFSQPASQGGRMEVRGVVRAVAVEPIGAGAAETLLITIADGRDRLAAAFIGWRSAQGLPVHLIGSQVKVRGVFNTTAFDGRAMLANRLLAGTLRDLQVEQAADDFAALEPESVAEARFAADDPGNAERVRVRGLVTAAVPGKGMFIQDASAGLWVDCAPVPAAGETVDVAGFPVMREDDPLLEDAVWQATPEALRIEPPLITAAEAFSGGLDGRLVQVEALLLTVSTTEEGHTLVLQDGERVFLARCADRSLQLPSLGENSWLRIVGVCVNARAPQLPASVTAPPVSFHLLMPGPASVQIARAPSWWTLQRVLAAGALLTLMTLAAGVWAATLRWRVAQQTEQIREHLGREAISEARLRIARELHDSVQQDLLGITMQIKATDRLLEAAPEKARAALNLASAMVRRSQAETHRAVWDLRESAAGQADLTEALAHVCEGVSTTETAVELTCSGDTRALPVVIEGQVLRVAQEALTNALKHSGATRVSVGLHFGPAEVSLTVRDDGRGFDADHPPSAASGHFGLYGMRERAIKLGAALRVTSAPGEGTAVHLDVPAPAGMGESEALRTPTGLRFIPRTSPSP